MANFLPNYDYDPGAGGPLDLREDINLPHDLSSLQYQLAVATLMAQQSSQTKALIIAASGALSTICGACITCLSSHSAAFAIGAAAVACGFPALLAGLYTFYKTGIPQMHLHIQ